jgi:Protein of unknown function (DUF1588)/Protein of unknown function (DUF1592)/Protein of unknown function (DUF1595)/Protein of unknown function (DUF1587)/Protein of unknown function (DUF1585)
MKLNLDSRSLLPLSAWALWVASGCSGPDPSNGGKVAPRASGGAAAGFSTGGTDASVVGGSGAGGDGSTVVAETRLRRLTESEYRNSVEALVGPIHAALRLTPDLKTEGFASIGASVSTITELQAEQYETAARAITSEVFGDAARWGTLVGCSPRPDLGDTCVETFVGELGRQAFRRALTPDERRLWTKVARHAAAVTGRAERGLAVVTQGILQSPNFLYRVETTTPDATSGRLRFDGLSMASRLSYLLKSTTPSSELLDAAAAGLLDTSDGVRAAATQLLAEPGGPTSLVEFFAEFANVDGVLEVVKAEEFALDADLRASMLEETQRWLSEVVLAPGADVRTFFDSNQTYVDARMASHYGISPAPTLGSGFVPVTLPADRPGIFGKASFLTTHSATNQTSPTRRGHFIYTHLLCGVVPPAPPGVDTEVELDPGLTTKQRFDLHRTDPSCSACHALMDPYGMGLEKFDPIGRYREKEGELQIDPSGTVGTASYAGSADLAQLLKLNPEGPACMVKKFYLYANARTDGRADRALLEELSATLAAQGYVWRDLVIDFAASEAFRSAPAAPSP